MAADISKNLERAKKFIEKNRVEDAIEAYLAVLEDAPQHLEASQALGDLYTRMEQSERAAVCMPFRTRWSGLFCWSGWAMSV